MRTSGIESSAIKRFAACKIEIRKLGAITRTRLGLQRALLVQYTGLKFSAALYDAGHRTEATRIANALFILLGPRSRNHLSILDQLDIAGSRLIPSTAGYPWRVLSDCCRSNALRAQ